MLMPPKGVYFMIEQDTVRLLRECDAGIKMGIRSIEDVETHVKNEEFRHHLSRCKQAHQALQDKLQSQLEQYHDRGKDPNPIATGMSWMKTTLKLGMEDSDRVIADLMIDGCNMGVKSLGKYLNQYKAADEVSKDITHRLIKLEDQLAQQLRPYL